MDGSCIVTLGTQCAYVNSAKANSFENNANTSKYAQLHGITPGMVHNIKQKVFGSSTVVNVGPDSKMYVHLVPAKTEACDDPGAPTTDF